MRVFLLLVLLSTLPGCATASLATLGTVAGLGATAVGTGANVYSLGKLDSAEAHDIDTTWLAVNQTMQRLGFVPRSAVVDGPKWFVRYADDRGSEIDITLDARTHALTRLRINVGLFGDEPTARLLLQHIRNHLGEPGPQQALGFGAY